MISSLIARVSAFLLGGAGLTLLFAVVMALVYGAVLLRGPFDRPVADR